MKKELSLKSKLVENVRFFMGNGQTILVSCSNRKGTIKNVLAVTWVTPTSFNPLLFLISIGKEKENEGIYRFSYQLIEESKEFVINVPTIDLKEKVLQAGSIHGKDIDKFKKVRLTPIKAKITKAPLIEECILNIECRVMEEFETGDHTVFVGETVAVHYNEGVITEDGFSDKYKQKSSMVHIIDLLGEKI
jgi:flavin reductase (DIM6/NTAB) family NADH-FMN oxidoreductase RutF